MISFIAAFNLPDANDRDPAAFLRRTALLLGERMPSVGPEPRITLAVLPEVGGGWALLVPEPRPRLALIEQVVTDTHAVLLFGDLQGESRASPASAVLRAWMSGGGAAVAALDGNFSAIVVDRAERTVAVISDLLGRRALRTLHAGGVLHVSPHDVALAATGACPVEIDHASACSILAADWSIGGRPLLAGVEPCDPARWLRFRGGRLERLAAPLGLFERRIDARDAAAIRERTDQIVDNMRENARFAAASCDTVQADLTAGIDSRAAFALLASVVPAERIVARTTGAADSLDVRVARRIAALSGVRHAHRELDMPIHDDFSRHADLIAFHMNGDSSAKRAIDSYPSWDDERPLNFEGGGGEIFRGYYYARPGQYRRVARASAGDVAAFFVRKWRRLTALSYRSPDPPAAVRERTLAVIEAMFGRSPDLHDVLDQFYLFERYGRWGALTSRFLWWRTFTPYASPSVVRLAFSLPSPISTHAALHDAIVRRFLPSARSILVNDNSLLPLQGAGVTRRLARDLLYVTGEIWRAAAAWRGRSVKERRSADAMRADAIAGPLHAYARDVLLSRDSIAVDLLGHGPVARLLDEHRARRQHLETLCNLLGIEHFRRLAVSTAAAASRR
ncbi:hypothetical protein WME75_45085 [Sorangium sp. So ce1014]|uniref:hypothetical protein n=1 Tax=Sorangium sp. So ce1014 TaxID=3133326 RepID=UPI003F626ACE